jgi:spore maturation protein CgeE
MGELERCIAFLRSIDERAAERELVSPYGVAYFYESLPRVWSRNYFVAERDLDEISAELLAAEADRLLGGAGLSHRKIEIYDEGTGASVEPGLRGLGWNVNCDLIMVARGAPDRGADTSPTEEVELEALEPVWAEGIASEPYGREEDVVRQLLENKRIVMGAVETRFFAARVEGQIASYCDLYSDGRTGQIESVMTVDAYRNRGLARAVVSRALEESRAAGNDLTFLMAHRDDWPQELYRKLGFEEVGRIYDFIRPG